MELKTYVLASIKYKFKYSVAKSSWDIIEIVHIPPSVNQIFNVFMNIYEYANKIICICNMGIIGICLSFNLVLSLVVWDK